MHKDSAFLIGLGGLINHLIVLVLFIELPLVLSALIEEIVELLKETFLPLLNSISLTE